MAASLAELNREIDLQNEQSRGRKEKDNKEMSVRKAKKERKAKEDREQSLPAVEELVL